MQSDKSEAWELLALNKKLFSSLWGSVRSQIKRGMFYALSALSRNAIEDKVKSAIFYSIQEKISKETA